MNGSNLSLSMGINTAPFTNGMNGARLTLIQFNQTINNTSAPVRRLGREMDSMGGWLKSFAGQALAVGSAWQVTKKILGDIADINRLERSLSAVSSGAGDLARSQTFLRDTALTLGRDYAGLTQSFVGFKAATQGTSIEGAAAERIFSSVAKASASLGLTTEQTKGSMMALQQMLSKGTISSEELRGQLGERLPGAFKLMADALGVVQPKLAKMLEDGEVMATDALPKLAAELEKTYGPTAQQGIEGITGGVSNLRTQWTLLLEALDKSFGIDKFVGGFLTGLGQAMNGMSTFINTYNEFVGRLGISTLLGSGDPDKFLPQWFNGTHPLQVFTQAVYRKGDRDRVKQEEEVAMRAGTPEQRSQRITASMDRRQLAQETAESENNKPLFDKKGNLLPDDVLSKRSKLIRRMGDEQAFYNDLLKTQQRIDAEMVAEEARNAQRKKTEADALKQLNAKKGKKEKAVKPIPSGYQLAKELEKFYEKDIQDLLAQFGDGINEKDHPMNKVFVNMNKILRQVRVTIKDVDDAFEAFENRGKIDFEVKVTGTGDFTNLMRFVGQGGKQYFNPGDKTQGMTNPMGMNLQVPAPNDLQYATPFAAKLESERAKREAKLASYAAIGKIYTPQASGGAMDRWDDVFQKTMDKTDDFQTAFDRANRVVVEAGGQLQSSLESSLQGAAGAAAIGMGEIIGGLIAGTAKLSDIPKMIGAVFADMATTMGKAMIAFGTAGIAAQVFVEQPWAALAAGIALVALGSAMKSSMQNTMNEGMGGGGGGRMMHFASGGVFDKPTVGLFGEYPNAARNREIATPERLMQKIFQGELDKIIPSLSGGISSVTVMNQNAPVMAPVSASPIDVRVGVDRVEIDGHMLAMVMRQTSRSEAEYNGR